MSDEQSESADQTQRVEVRREVAARLWWRLALFGIPLAYVAWVLMPQPFGLGIWHGGDFNAHRIWWTSLATSFIGRGFLPINHPGIEFGALFPGWRGHALYYPFGWWLHLPFMSERPGVLMVAEYVHVVLHMGTALVGLYLVLRRFAHTSRPAAALGCLCFLANQRFHDAIRYPNAVEAITWIPWALWFLLRLLALPAGDVGRASRIARRESAGLALCLLLSWLAGYGQVTYIACLFLGVVALFATRTFGALIWAAGGVAIGSVLAVGTLWPTLLATRLIPNRAGLDPAFADQHGLEFGYWRMFFDPFSENVHASAYFLPILWIPVFIGLFACWRAGRGRMSLGLLVAGLLLAELARGSSGNLFVWAHEHLPMYGAFRIQGRNNWIALIALAWFLAVGSDRLMQAGAPVKLAVLVLATCVSLWMTLNMPSPPDLLSGYAPYKFHELAPDIARRNNGILLMGGVLWFAAYLVVRTIPSRAVLLALHCGIFVFFFGRYSGFYKQEVSFDVLPDYPSGFLVTPRHGVSLMSAPMVGEDFVPERELYRRHVPDGTQFPANRFLFVPDGGVAGKAVPEVHLRSYGPNHLFLDIRTLQPGRLIYFRMALDGWKANLPLVAAPDPFTAFLCVRVKEGPSRLELQFVPWSVIAAGLVSVAGMFLLAGAGCMWSGWNGRMVLCLVAAFIASAFFMWGVSARHSVSDQFLFGPDKSTLDPSGQIPEFIIAE